MHFLIYMAIHVDFDGALMIFKNDQNTRIWKRIFERKVEHENKSYTSVKGYGFE